MPFLSVFLDDRPCFSQGQLNIRHAFSSVALYDDFLRAAICGAIAGSHDLVSLSRESSGLKVIQVALLLVVQLEHFLLCAHIHILRVRESHIRFRRGCTWDRYHGNGGMGKLRQGSFCRVRHSLLRKVFAAETEGSTAVTRE